MKAHRSFTAPASKFLTLIVFLAITLLLMWEYRVTRASQQGMADHIAHQNEETADLIIKAITPYPCYRRRSDVEARPSGQSPIRRV